MTIIMPINNVESKNTGLLWIAIHIHRFKYYIQVFNNGINIIVIYDYVWWTRDHIYVFLYNKKVIN